MKSIFHLRCTCLAVVLSILIPLGILSQSIDIIPAPQNIQKLPSAFTFTQSVNVVFQLPDQEDHPLNEQLKSILSDIKKHATALHTATLWAGLLNENEELADFCENHQLNTGKLGKEGYAIHVQTDSIIVAAHTSAGLLYGFYSLKQLIQQNITHTKVPGVQIIDYPAFKYRAVMDDISRGPLSNMDFLKHQIRRLSSLKINLFSFYIEHVIKTKTHPDFAPADGITVEEFGQLSDYAKAYNIELIGSFQSLGHFRNILNSPNYRHLGQTDRMLKPGHPESIRFLQEVYDEMIPVFSSSYFNINADEAWDLIRGDLKELADSVGPGVLFANHVQPLLNHVRDRGKKPMLWGDMLLSYPQAFEYIPDHATILTWEYGALDSFADWIDPIKSRGFDFWVCPGIVNSYRIFPDYEEAFVNIENFINEGYEKDAKGVMTTIWDDGGGHFFSRDWGAVAFAAEQSWHPKRNGRLDFKGRFSNVFYQDTENYFLDAIFKLNQLKTLNTTQSLNTAFLEEQLLPQPGKKHLLNTMDLDAIHEILDSVNILIKPLTIKQIEASSPWYQDIKYWTQVIDHLTLQLDTYQGVLTISDQYRQLYNTGDSPNSKSFTDLFNATNQLLKEWKLLQLRFEELWNIENRNYWMEEATQIYSAKISVLSSLKNRLQNIKNHSKKIKLPPLDLGLDIYPNEKNYFTFWLVSKSFPLNATEEPFSDFLGELGGELKAIPTPYDWLKYQSPFADRLDLFKLYPNIKNEIIYVYCRIESDSNRVVSAILDFDGSYEIILNGANLKLSDQPAQNLPLKTGKNHLILKLLATDTSHEMSFSILDYAVRNRKQKYKLHHKLNAG